MVALGHLSQRQVLAGCAIPDKGQVDRDVELFGKFDQRMSGITLGRVEAVDNDDQGLSRIRFAAQRLKPDSDGVVDPIGPKREFIHEVSITRIARLAEYVDGVTDIRGRLIGSAREQSGDRKDNAETPWIVIRGEVFDFLLFVIFPDLKVLLLQPMGKIVFGARHRGVDEHHIPASCF